MKKFIEKSFNKVINSMVLFMYIMVYLQFYPNLQSDGDKFIGAIMVGATYGLTIVMIRGMALVLEYLEDRRAGKDGIK
jgi:membrane-bound metal-dependent hydrolase YbcI (DUF457 family)